MPGEPCPRGAAYFPIVAMPRRPPRHRELGPEERAARKAASEQASAAAAALHVQLLAAGMEAWIARARQRWLEAGGYGFPLSREDEAAIRAAGFQPAPVDLPEARLPADPPPSEHSSSPGGCSEG